LDASTPYHPKAIEDVSAVAPAMSIELKFARARTLEEIDRAFSTISRAHAQD